MTDDDDLDDLDVHAWQAPLPPKGLAESVIARVTATDEAIAVAMRHQRRRFVTIGVACAGTVAAGLALWLGLQPTPRAAVTDEVIIADERQHFAFGASVVDLDPGSAIRMHRNGDELHVVQSGTATWHVAANERLVIDAGSSASIEATGANLRVETKMNPSYVMSGVALTAGAVALVSATVYEGSAKVKSADQTVVVLPQNRATVANMQIELESLITTAQQLDLQKIRPLDVKHAGDLAIAPGTSATIYKMGGEVSLDTPVSVIVEFQAPCELEVKGHGHARSIFPSFPPAKDGVVAVPLGLGYYEYTATCTGGTLVTGTLDIRPDYCRHRECGDAEDRLVLIDAPTEDSVFTPPTVHVAGSVVDGSRLAIGHNVIPTDAHHGFALDLDYADYQSVTLRVDHPTRGTQFYVQRSQDRHGGAATVAKPAAAVTVEHGSGATQVGPHQIEMNIPSPSPAKDVVRVLPPPDACDVDKLLSDGAEASSTGDSAGALKKFEASYVCKPDEHTTSLAFMASCNSQNVARARFWWRKLDRDQQNHLLQMCIHANISRDQLDAP